MSVVSLARTAGVTWLLSKSRSWIVSTSLRAGAHEHDVDQSLGDDLAHQLPILVQRAEAGLAGVVLGTAARRGQAEGHVGVLGVGQDEVAARGIGQDPGEFSGPTIFACGSS